MTRRAQAGPVTDSSLPAPMVAGYRLVRRLGSGSRADVYLGSSAGAGVASTAAIKVFRPTTARDTVTSELAALERATLPHCVQLLDVAEDDTGTPVAVLSRACRGSLASVLAERGTIALGEAVTILAPLAGIVPLLHAAGLAHGGISAASVHFGDAGEPVLLGFGHSSLFNPGLAAVRLEQAAGVAGDRDRLALLASLVLDRVDPDESRPLRRWLAVLPRPLTAGFPLELEQRLFDLAGATAVTLPDDIVRVRVRHQPAVPLLRPDETGNTVPVPSEHRDATRATRAARTRRRGARDHKRARWVSELLGHNPLSGARDSLVLALRRVRRSVWVAATLVGVAVLVVLPLAGGAGLWSPSAESTPAGDGAERPEVPANSDLAESAVGALPDDPVAALPLLLAERSRCFNDLSVLCLDAVTQQESTAAADDRAAIEALLAGERSQGVQLAEVAGAEPVLVERLGDSALVAVDGQSEPASVLMIRTEAGWRIREIFAPESAAD
jgi:hypothetical protein